MIKSVTITTDQSLFDVVLQYYGDVSRVYDFIALNQSVIPNINFNNLKGKTVQYEEQTNAVTANYKRTMFTPSTKYPQIQSTPYSESFLISIDFNFQLSLELSEVSLSI